MCSKRPLSQAKRLTVVVVVVTGAPFLTCEREESFLAEEDAVSDDGLASLSTDVVGGTAIGAMFAGERRRQGRGWIQSDKMGESDSIQITSFGSYNFFRPKTHD